MRIRIHIRLLPFFIIVGIVFFNSSCAQRPQPEPVDVPPISPPPEKEPEKETPSVSIYDILSNEAEKFTAQGNYQDALLIYNQAFAQADEQQVLELIPRVEALLSQTPSHDISRFIDRPGIALPKALLTYWLGWNLAYEDQLVEAKKVLHTYIQTYPDHNYVSDAAELLRYLNQKTFQRRTIGCMLPLSGKYAVFGQQALNGIQMAVKDLSEKYNLEFLLYIEDTKADPLETVEAVKRLEKKNVCAIVGPLLNVREAGMQAEELSVPLIAFTQKEDFASMGDYLFSNFITPQMQVQTLSAYLFGELGIQKVAILYPREPYGEKYMNLFWDKAIEHNAQIMGAESYDGGKTDFTTALQKLTGEYYPLPDFLKPEPDPEFVDASVLPEDFFNEKDQSANSRKQKEEKDPVIIDFQALFIPDSPSKIKLILPQLAFNDILDVYLIGTNLWHHKSLVTRDVGRYNGNTIITDGFFNKSTQPRAQAFSANFQQLFGHPPQFLEAISYDTATFLYSTAMYEDVDSREKLKMALQGGTIYEGVTGVTVFDKKGNAYRQLFLMTIKNNRFVEISH
jgi:branched-chain amino acid transport system substrate-binding protein